MKDHNANLDALAVMLLGEVHELLQEITNGCDLDEVTREAADVGWYLLALFELLDRDMYSEMMEKHAFNMCRYMACYFQNGDYYEARSRVKQEEKELKLGDTFYE